MLDRPLWLDVCGLLLETCQVTVSHLSEVPMSPGASKRRNGTRNGRPRRTALARPRPRPRRGALARGKNRGSASFSSAPPACLARARPSMRRSEGAGAAGAAGHRCRTVSRREEVVGFERLCWSFLKSVQAQRTAKEQVEEGRMD